MPSLNNLIEKFSTTAQELDDSQLPSEFRKGDDTFQRVYGHRVYDKQERSSAETGKFWVLVSIEASDVVVVVLAIDPQIYVFINFSARETWTSMRWTTFRLQDHERRTMPTRPSNLQSST